MQKKLELGRYSDEELLELAEGDAQGGTGAACVSAVTSVISAASAIHICPTETCTNSC